MKYPSDKSQLAFPIAECEFTPETGFSYVTIVTPYGRFTGTAQVHPEDMEKNYFSSFSGQSIAHLRAYIEYLKYMKNLKIYTRLEMMRCWATAKKKNPTSAALAKRIEELDEEITEYRFAIADLKDLINEKIDKLEKYYKARNE